MGKSKPPLIIIAGPTGVGKTELALRMAASLGGGEIINADSMQVYRHMDIGTAKPTKAQREVVPHHLIDVVNPDEPFNVAIYTTLARSVIEAGVGRGNLFFVVGGTGLYIKSLLGGIVPGPSADEGLREHYKEQLRSCGVEHLYNLLEKKDPKAAASVDRRNAARIIRALEVWDLTGESIIEMQREHRFMDRPYNYLKIGLRMDGMLLREKIERRTGDMIKRGLVDEVQWLLSHGYHDGLKSMQALGYRHVLRYLRGEGTLEDCISLITRDTRRYAKRQMTWLGADPEVQWYDVQDAESIGKRIKDFVANVGAG